MHQSDDDDAVPDLLSDSEDDEPVPDLVSDSTAGSDSEPAELESDTDEDEAAQEDRDRGGFTGLKQGFLGKERVKVKGLKAGFLNKKPGGPFRSKDNAGLGERPPAPYSFTPAPEEGEPEEEDQDDEKDDSDEVPDLMPAQSESNAESDESSEEKYDKDSHEDQEASKGASPFDSYIKYAATRRTPPRSKEKFRELKEREKRQAAANRRAEQEEARAQRKQARAERERRRREQATVSEFDVATELAEQQRLLREEELRKQKGVVKSEEEVEEMVGRCRGMKCTKEGLQVAVKSHKYMQIKCTEGCLMLFHMEPLNCYRSDCLRRMQNEDPEWKLGKGSRCPTPECDGDIVQARTVRNSKVVYDFTPETDKKKKKGKEENDPVPQTRKQMHKRHKYGKDSELEAVPPVYRRSNFRGKKGFFNLETAPPEGPSSELDTVPGSKQEVEAETAPAAASDYTAERLPRPCSDVDCEERKPGGVKVLSRPQAALPLKERAESVMASQYFAALEKEGPLQVLRKKDIEEELVVGSKEKAKLKGKQKVDTDKIPSKQKRQKLQAIPITDFLKLEESEDEDTEEFTVAPFMHANESWMQLGHLNTAQENFPELARVAAHVRPGSSSTEDRVATRLLSILEADPAKPADTAHLLLENVDPKAEEVELRGIFEVYGDLSYCKIFREHEIAGVSFMEKDKALTAAFLANSRPLGRRKYKAHLVDQQVTQALVDSVDPNIDHYGWTYGSPSSSSPQYPTASPAQPSWAAASVSVLPGLKTGSSASQPLNEEANFKTTLRADVPAFTPRSVLQPADSASSGSAESASCANADSASSANADSACSQDPQTSESSSPLTLRPDAAPFVPPNELPGVTSLIPDASPYFPVIETDNEEATQETGGPSLVDLSRRNYLMGQVIACNQSTLALYKSMPDFQLEMNQLFGELCSYKKVTAIRPGNFALFLFDVETSSLYGVYESSSSGLVMTQSTYRGLQTAAATHVTCELAEELPVCLTALEIENLDGVFPEGWTLNPFLPFELNQHQVNQLVLTLEAKAAAFWTPHEPPEDLWQSQDSETPPLQGQLSTASSQLSDSDEQKTNSEVPNSVAMTQNLISPAPAPAPKPDRPSSSKSTRSTLGEEPTPVYPVSPESARPGSASSDTTGHLTESKPSISRLNSANAKLLVDKETRTLAKSPAQQARLSPPAQKTPPRTPPKTPLKDETPPVFAPLFVPQICTPLETPSWDETPPSLPPALAPCLGGGSSKPEAPERPSTSGEEESKGVENEAVTIFDLLFPKARQEGPPHKPDSPPLPPPALRPPNRRYNPLQAEQYRLPALPPALAESPLAADLLIRPSTPESFPTSFKVVTTSKQGHRVRDAVGGKEIGLLRHGERVKALETKDCWLKIEFPGHPEAWSIAKSDSQVFLERERSAESSRAGPPLVSPPPYVPPSRQPRPTPAQPYRPVSTTQEAPATGPAYLCHFCRRRRAAFLSLQCRDSDKGHLGPCLECKKDPYRCPVPGCGKMVNKMMRVYL